MRERDVRLRAAWRFVRAVIRCQASAADGEVRARTIASLRGRRRTVAEVLEGQTLAVRVRSGDLAHKT
jgi:hypothetical protein